MHLENVSKSYYSKCGNEYKVLKNINLEIKSGEMLGITGDSGSGKSTLLNILGCNTDITSGKYYLDGHETNNLKHSKRQKIKNEFFGLVLQEFGLIDSISAYDNIEVPLLLNNAISFNEMPLMIEKALQRVDVLHLSNKIIETLSGGEKQKVAIARAIVMKPEIILADEPTGSLDSTSTNMIINVLRKINEETSATIVLVTHNPMVSEHCDRVVKLVDGKMFF